MSVIKYFHLTIIRHGETDENKNKIIQGHMETKLSDIGLLQAKQTGIFLKNVPIDLIYCSDLMRTCQTANEIAIRNEQILKNTVNHSGNSIITSSALRERSFGVYTGWSLEDWRNELRNNDTCSKSWVPLNGESINQVRDRAIHSFSDLCQIMLKQESRDGCHPCPVNAISQSNNCKMSMDDFDGKMQGHVHNYSADRPCESSMILDSRKEYLGHLLLMSHGGFINQLISYLVSINLSPIEYEYKHIPNCSITQLSVIFTNNKKSAKVDFHSINFTGHLSKETYPDNV